jgi:hypothetical protein
VRIRRLIEGVWGASASAPVGDDDRPGRMLLTRGSTCKRLLSPRREPAGACDAPGVRLCPSSRKEVEASPDGEGTLSRIEGAVSQDGESTLPERGWHLPGWGEYLPARGWHPRGWGWHSPGLRRQSPRTGRVLSPNGDEPGTRGGVTHTRGGVTHA